MAEGAYVQLTKDQASLQNITPGELNQPINVDKVYTTSNFIDYFSFFLEN